MKNQLLSAVFSLLTCLPLHAYNETTHTWYTMSIGNSAVVTTTFGCIDTHLMYERHEVKASTWNNQWQAIKDYDYTFKFYDYNQLPISAQNAPVMRMHTSKLHDTSGRTIDADGNDLSVLLYSLRPYEPINSRSGNQVGDTPLIGRLRQDPQCHILSAE